MANENDSPGRGQDRRKVASGQEHQVNYESKKTGADKEEVKETIKEVGNERKRLRKN